jgi:hypothetical protein
VLVALDGSLLAEGALQKISKLAPGMALELVFLRVVTLSWRLKSAGGLRSISRNSEAPVEVLAPGLW